MSRRRISLTTTRRQLGGAIPAVVAWLLALLLAPAAVGATVEIHFFWNVDCPHCHAMAETLDEIDMREADVAIHAYEVTRNSGNAELYGRLVESEKLPAVVPIVLVGDSALIGHGASSEAQLRRMIADCRVRRCPDLLARHRLVTTSHTVSPSGATSAPVRAGAAPLPAEGEGRAKLRVYDRITIPWLGEIEAASLSLPLLTLTMAAIDGFNPCAMWVLVFLIGLLLGIGDRRRMWLLAGTFLLATAAVYFVVLAAWLNALLLLGSIAWLRIAIGSVAIGAGGIYLREALRREETCPVTQPERRRRIFDRLRQLVQQPSLWLAMIGITLLAVAVNLVELLCSAGIPAVYTGILAQSDLPMLHYYAYLALYIAVFLADDVAIVVVAMVTLKLGGGSSGYARWVRVFGGATMLMLGLLLIFRPGWLSFAQ